MWYYRIKSNQDTFHIKTKESSYDFSISRASFKQKYIHTKGRDNFNESHWPYLPTTELIVTPFNDSISCLSNKEHVPVEPVIEVDLGSFGKGRSTVSLFNSSITEGMAGLFGAESCTHSSPTCMHRKASSVEHVSLIQGSISSIPFPSFKWCQAWNRNARMWETVRLRCKQTNSEFKYILF